ncbi:MAG: FliM/FliN family flagellar motor C-terminal domain-containing protein [Burkholderiales bacterium]|nr:FliM/FliN family flagellar motor C-terminal domain-containing protein [Burkholderiales bacterium]
MLEQNIEIEEYSTIENIEECDKAIDETAVVNPTNIDLPIVVVIGSVKLSLKKLSELKLGDVVKIDDWNQIVKLYLSEQLIAEGILVDIDGIIGVKITNKSSS